jgi:hypothetical protein
MGIIGLTVARELRSRWPSAPLTFYASSLNVANTTSYYAGGQFGPSQIVSEYSKNEETLKNYLTLSKSAVVSIIGKGLGDTYGIRSANNYALKRDSELDFAFEAGVLKRQDTALNLNGKAFDGYLYKTWLLNPKKLLPQLDRELANIPRRQQTFANKNQVVTTLREPIIINCTGYGARKLFADEAVEPHRGHLVVLPNPDRQKYVDFFSFDCPLTDDHAVSYVFERHDDIVVGGSVRQPPAGAKPATFQRFEREYFDFADRGDPLDPNEPKDPDFGCQILRNAQKTFDGAPNTCKPDALGACISA